MSSTTESINRVLFVPSYLLFVLRILSSLAAFGLLDDLSRIISAYFDQPNYCNSWLSLEIVKLFGQLLSVWSYRYWHQPMSLNRKA